MNAPSPNLRVRTLDSPNYVQVCVDERKGKKEGKKEGENYLS